jgi:hypothetical protein
VGSGLAQVSGKRCARPAVPPRVPTSPPGICRLIMQLSVGAADSDSDDLIRCLRGPAPNRSPSRYRRRPCDGRAMKAVRRCSTPNNRYIHRSAEYRKIWKISISFIDGILFARSCPLPS